MLTEAKAALPDYKLEMKVRLFKILKRYKAEQRTFFMIIYDDSLWMTMITIMKYLGCAHKLGRSQAAWKGLSRR